MSHYDEHPDDLLQDTKNFLASDYGKYVVGTLNEIAAGHLTNAADINIMYPERHAAKYSAIKDTLNLIYSPLEDDTPSHG